MLADREAAATIAVKNLAKARAFYEGKLGFKRFGPDGPDVEDSWRFRVISR